MILILSFTKRLSIVHLAFFLARFSGLDTFPQLFLSFYRSQTIIHLAFSPAPFLVACTRLYKPLCQFVGPSVGPSVRSSLIARSRRLMAIGLVYLRGREKVFVSLGLSRG